MKLLELFGGIGACSKALERLGIDYEIADYVEIDKYAVASYNAIHNTHFEPQDIREWDKDIDVDLIMHGSPCQDFSVAGKGAGGDEGSGTRSSLMYETIRIVNKLKPKYVIWENVKNLLSEKHKHNFNKYAITMNKLGYNSYYQVLNAKDYGIPQNRERVFTISIRQDVDMGYMFPEKQELKLKLKDILEKNVDGKYFLSDEQIEKIVRNNYRQARDRIQGKEISDILCARDWKDPKCVEVSGNVLLIKNNTKKGYLEAKEGYGIDLDHINSNTHRGRVQKDMIQTLSAQSDKGTVLSDLRIRKLTPKECWRLMGFDDEDFEKASQVNSNTQLYKQAGNSIVVNVLEGILKNLLNEGSFEGQINFDILEKIGEVNG